METAMTTQQGLNEVVINKVQRMIENKAVGVQATMERLVNEGKIAQDYIAPIGVELRRNDHSPIITFSENGHVLMNMQSGQYTLHGNAIGQLADKMGIPSRYLRQLASGDEWQRQLAATVLNEHSGWTQRTRVLIRTVGQQVRGVLSDSYRRLNSVEILTAFVQEASQQGAVIADAYMSDTKVWAETILPQPIVVPTVKNGEVVIFAVRDLTRGLFSKDNIMQKAIEIQGAAEIDVDFDQELKRLVKAGSLLKSEGESVEKILMRNDPDDGVQGGATLWKLTQAITAHARELEPRRSRELHEISGALLNRVKVTA